MSLKYTYPIKTQLFNHALKTELNNLRIVLSESDNPNIKQVIGSTMAAFKKLLTSLWKPGFSGKTIKGDDEISLVYYNSIRKEAKDDIVGADKELSALASSMTEAFNLSQVFGKELEGLVSELSSRVQDISILNGVNNQDVLVAGDDFSSLNFINTAYPLGAQLATIDTLQGIATLTRIHSESVIDPENTEIKVTPASPSDATPEPKPNNLKRFYEGRFYALGGQAEPEGGQWHLEERARYDAEGYTKNESIVQSKNGEVFNVVNTSTPSADQGAANIMGSADIVIADRGASNEEKAAIRTRMVDGNPDTYWQCEYIFKPKFVITTPGPDGFGSSSSGGLIGDSYAEYPDLRLGLGAPPGSAAEADLRSSVTIEDLNANAKLFDQYDFEINIEITLPRPVVLNWLSLNPMNFGETTWLKITALETKEDRETSEWSEISGFSRNIFDNVLTDDANAELSNNEVGQVLSANKYAYRGIGVWTFPSRQVQVIRFGISQEIPLPILYQRFHVQLKRTKDTAVTNTYQSSSRNLVSDEDVQEIWTKVVKLDYLQTVQVFQGVTQVNQLINNDIVHSSANTYSTPQQERSTLETLLDPLNLFGGSNRTSSHGESVTDTGYQLSTYWLETYYDLLGYRIGIRDIQAFRHLYSLSSEFVSVAWVSPKEIRKITLSVDEILPEGCDIKYYISPNNGKDWYRVNPLDKPSIYSSSGEAIPRILVINQPGAATPETKYITTEAPVTSIMLKAIFSSGTDATTPVLKRYRLLIYPAEGLRLRDVVV